VVEFLIEWSIQFNKMEKFLDELIMEFKKKKKVRGNNFHNFVVFVDFCLKNIKGDKYLDIKKSLLKYIIANEETITLKLVRN